MSLPCAETPCAPPSVSDGRLAGALAHLAAYLETGCPRAGQRAALIFGKLADDADDALRLHTGELVDILGRPFPRPGAPRSRPVPPAGSRR